MNFLTEASEYIEEFWPLIDKLDKEDGQRLLIVILGDVLEKTYLKGRMDQVDSIERVIEEFYSVEIKLESYNEH